MATLTNSYQYLGRSDVMKSVSGSLNYYLLLFAKTSADQTTGKHTVTLLGRLASVNTKATFYGYSTSYSGTVAGVTAFSGTEEPNAAWEYINSTGTVIGGVTYKTYTDIGSGAVTVDCSDGKAKDITLSFKWSMSSNESASYTPAAGTSRTVKVTVTLPAIPRSSVITAADDITLGNYCRVAWTPLLNTYHYKLEFSIGTWASESDIISPNSTSAYVYTGTMFPLEIAKQITDDPKGSVTVKLYTYSDSSGTKQIGSVATDAFDVTVPENEDTIPSLTALFAPQNDFSEAFGGVYVQGKSKVKVTMEAYAQLGADIDKYEVTVNGNTVSGNPAVTNYLSTAGNVVVTAVVTDSRGFSSKVEQTINVTPYSKPRVIPYSGALDIICERSLEDKTPASSGTYLHIKAGRNYWPLTLDGVQKNYCTLEYRYCADGGTLPNTYISLIEKSNLTADYVDIAIGGVCGDVSQAYIVELRAIDDIGEYSTVTVIVPTDNAILNIRPGGKVAALGRYAKAEDPEGLTSAWDVYFDEGKRIHGGFEDYIVEQGTDGIWTYRKWNSGIAECWGYTEQALSTVSAGNEFTCLGEDIPLPNELFTAAPIPSVCSYAPRYCHCTVCEIHNDKIQLYYITLTAYEGTTRTFLRMIGKWK